MATPCPSVNIRPLDCETDSVSVCLSEPVSGTFVQAPLDCATDSVTVCPDPGNPIIVTPPNLDCSTDSVTVCPDPGNPLEVQGTFEVPESGAFAQYPTYGAASATVTFTSLVGGTTQILSLWRSAAAATNTLELLEVNVSIALNADAVTTDVSLNRTNAATIPSGGTVLTIVPFDTTSPGSTADVRTLPTTEATTVAPFRTQGFTLGIIGGRNSTAGLVNAPLYLVGNYRHEEPFRLLPGVAQGVSIDVTTDVASLQTWTVDLRWVEF